MLFVARNIQANRVNLLMNDFVAGLPSPLSFIGLVDSIIRDLELPKWSGRVLPVLHSCTVSPGRMKPEMVNTSSNFTPAETPEYTTGRVEVSLVLDIPDFTDTDRISKLLVTKRIAGGVVENRHVPVKRLSNVTDILRYMPRGYAVLGPQDENKKILCSGTAGDLDALARQVFPDEYAPGAGWHIPVAAGYRLLEDVSNSAGRRNTRDSNIPHVFAEPLAGIAELVSIRNDRLTKLPFADFDKLLWSWTHHDGLILGNTAFIPTTIN